MRATPILSLNAFNVFSYVYIYTRGEESTIAYGLPFSKVRPDKIKEYVSKARSRCCYHMKDRNKKKVKNNVK